MFLIGASAGTKPETPGSNPGSPLTKCVTLDTLVKLAEPQFHYL